MADDIARRFGVMPLVIFLAVTISFLIPRTMPGDPVETQLTQLLSQGGGSIGDVQAMVESSRARFGPERPLWAQDRAWGARCPPSTWA